ncbi:MAG: ribosome-associated translation inhibitor RaiA [Acidobacteriaceae bacterium]|nr:ribosome-associated translation inhibitor RaiA [Acidobacteriaceae bacterium]
MRLIVSGKTKDFTPALEEKFGAKLAKLSKFIERRGEREAHVMHQVERHLHKVEVNVNFYDHALVARTADPDLETALCQAVETLEKQVMKMRDRWRDNHRDAKGVRMMKENGAAPAPASAVETAEPVASPGNGRSIKPKIFRVNYDEGTKPMTLEEALLVIEQNDAYFVYRDYNRQCLSVLIRRPDGNYDLIES